MTLRRRKRNEPEAASVPGPVLERIKAAVGEKGWTRDPEILAPYLLDQRGLYEGLTPLLVRPARTAEVAEVVRICAQAGVAIVPQGGNTGLVGGAVPHERGGEILLNLSRMNAVREVDPANDTITVDAGCVLADVRAAAAEVDRLFPLSLGAEGSCQIGGNLSTNAGGVAVLRYGTARDLVLGLEVVLADGSVWDGLRGLRKDNTGYDLKHLFLGAEGTLGVITAAVLKLFPRPRTVETAFVAVTDARAAVELLSRARTASGDAVTAFEYVERPALELALRHVPDCRDPLADSHPAYVLIEVSSSRETAGLKETLEAALAQAIDDGLVRDAVVAASAAQAGALWRLREGVPEGETHEGASIKHDVAVPVSRVPDFVNAVTAALRRVAPDARVIAFGHIGDGNLHFNLSQPPDADGDAFVAERTRLNRIVYDIACGMGGTFSAEHGVGRLKRGELVRYRPPAEVALMRKLKAALDPKNIMNPGKVV
ncbi:MAG: FAD-binding oxidoreductase [Alphaproteobacteria bacterium]